MNCRDFQELLFDYLDGTVPASSRSAIEQHLEACEACREMLAEHQRLARALSGHFRQNAESVALAPAARQRLVAALLSPMAKPDQRRIPIFPTASSRTQAALINTPLQRGVAWWRELRNRFNGFSRGVETVETVSAPHQTLSPPLKRGVNERWHRLRRYEMSRPNTLPEHSIIQALAGFFSPAARRWALAGCLLAAAALTGSLWLGSRGPGLSSAAAAEVNVTVSTRVPETVTTYTFCQEDQFVTDVLTTRAETVQETFQSKSRPTAPAKNHVNKISL